MEAHKKHIPVGQGLHFGWHDFHVHTKFYMLAGLIYIGLTVLYLAIATLFEDSSFLLLPFAILYSVAMWLYTVGYFKEVLLSVNGKTPDATRLFSYKQSLWPYIITLFVTNLITLAGTLLFIIPGIIWSLKYGLAPYLALDKGLSVKESLNESARITKGIKWDMIGAMIPLTIAGYLGFFALGIGLFVSLQVASIAGIFIYQSLLTQTTVKKATRKKPAKKKATSKK